MGLKNVMYKNLAAEMARKSLSTKEISSVLKISQASTRSKLYGKTELTIAEAFKIRNELFPIMIIDYLFDTKQRYDNIEIFNFPRTNTSKDNKNNTGEKRM